VNLREQLVDLIYVGYFPNITHSITGDLLGRPKANTWAAMVKILVIIIFTDLLLITRARHYS